MLVNELITDNDNCDEILQAAASPALENMINRPQKRRGDKRKIPILGVPDDAVSVFIKFLYSYR